ncbi:hypothetical protein NKH18_43240 [Streptomyces sp. M10(2022)]
MPATNDITFARSRVFRERSALAGRAAVHWRSAHTLRRRELLRRLDVVGLRLGESAAVLSDAMLKRSH